MMSKHISLVYDYDPIEIEDKHANRSQYRAYLRTRCAEAQSWRCAYCNEEMNLLYKSKKCVSLEHITPRSLGGEDTYENCVAACNSCNNKRGNNDLNSDYSIPTFLHTPKRPFEKQARRALKLIYLNVIVDKNSFDRWFSSLSLKKSTRQDVINIIKENSGLELNYL